MPSIIISTNSKLKAKTKMSPKPLTQKGFAAVGVILVVAALVAVGGVGYYVYRDNHKPKADKSAPQTASVTSNATTGTKASGKPAAKSVKPANIEVIQADGSIKIEPANEIAKTSDELDILNDLAKTCTQAPYSYLIVNYQVFTPGQKLFLQDGNYAEMDTSCAERATSADQLVGSGKAYYIRKQGSSWVVDAETQMGAPVCSKVDGKGYPTSIAPKCYQVGANSSVLRPTKQ